LLAPSESTAVTSVALATLFSPARFSAYYRSGSTRSVQTLRRSGGKKYWPIAGVRPSVHRYKHRDQGVALERGIVERADPHAAEQRDKTRCGSRAHRRRTLSSSGPGAAFTCRNRVNVCSMCWAMSSFDDLVFANAREPERPA